MGRQIQCVSVFDELWLNRKIAEKLITPLQKRQLLVSAIRREPHEGPCDAAFWKNLCPSISNKAANAFVAENVRHMVGTLIDKVSSANGRTQKLVIRMEDGAIIETCIIVKGPKVRRATVCVSCQVGCNMGCTFCATGTLGCQGNLECGEILEQFVRCHYIEHFNDSDKPIRNVVFMGMGEPMENYKNVAAAVRQLLDVHQISNHRITVSTVGYSPQRIRQMITDMPEVSLALSLHASNQALRAQLVPSSANVALDDLLSACNEFVENQRQYSRKKAKRQCLFVEYCVIRDVNDTHADELSHLLEPMKEKVIVNLIPYNPTDVKSKYKSPRPEELAQFLQRLKTNGFSAFLREECGQDVDAACGQLALTTINRRQLHHSVLQYTVGAMIGFATSIHLLRRYQR